MSADIVYATVRCCRDWTIIFGYYGELAEWRKCGLCREKPALVEIEQ